MYSRLRFIQCAALIFFGIIIAVGAPPLLVTAVRQPPIAGSRISDGPAVPASDVPPVAESASEQAAERRDEASVPQELPRQAETKPAEPAPTAPLAAPAIDDGSKGATAEAPPDAETAPTKPPTEIQQAARPSSDVAQQDETKGLRQAPAAPTSDDGSKAAAGSVSSRPESAPKPPEQTREPAAPSQESMRQGDIKEREQATAAPAAASETGQVARTPMATRARVSAAKNKRAAHADRGAKRSTTEAAKSVRRPADGLKDIPVSAYAADGTQRRIVIRPTSVQDVYYYSSGRSAPPSGANGAQGSAR